MRIATGARRAEAVDSSASLISAVGYNQSVELSSCRNIAHSCSLNRAQIIFDVKFCPVMVHHLPSQSAVRIHQFSQVMFSSREEACIWKHQAYSPEESKLPILENFGLIFSLTRKKQTQITN